MLRRLRGMQPEIHVRSLEKSYERSKKYVHIACEYPPPLLRRKGQRSPSASLQRLPVGVLAPKPRHCSTAPGRPDSRMDESLSDITDVGGELQYVVREDRVIDGAMYNVEMATDGSALA